MAALGHGHVHGVDDRARGGRHRTGQREAVLQAQRGGDLVAVLRAEHVARAGLGAFLVDRLAALDGESEDMARRAMVTERRVEKMKAGLTPERRSGRKVAVRFPDPPAKKP